MAAAAGPPPEAPEDEAPFVNVPARSRAEREAERDKDALEKQRLLVRTASRPAPRPALDVRSARHLCWERAGGRSGAGRGTVTSISQLTQFG